MMYTYKERKHHLVELRNPAMADADLELLRAKAGKVKPGYEKNPRKYAEEILYELLGVATREEIREHRRKALFPIPEQPEEKEEIKEKLEQTKEALEETDAQKEEIKEELEQTKEALDEAEARADEAESALEEEKKKAASVKKKTVAKRKSTKNTHG